MDKVQIMIVEDDMIIAADIMMQLNQLGYEVIGIFPRGEDALKQLEATKPDIVLMDINLKGKMDGIEVGQAIFDRYALPLIYLTANADDATFNRAKTTKPFAFISKPFKQFFRKNKPVLHWHVEEQAALIDPLQSITDKITVPAVYFFRELVSRSRSVEKESVASHPNPGSSAPVSGKEAWEKQEGKVRDYLARFLEECPFGELKATVLLLQELRPGDILHLGNSMPVRYANLLGSFLPQGVKVFCNRGTSGIEGVVSTAVGQALGSSGRVHCWWGMYPSFYDSNALFSAKADNLHIYLIQNGGGNIFRIIDGPGKQAELESCFITDPGRTAEGLCREAGYRYTAVRSEEGLRNALKNKEDEGAVLFEIYTNGVRDSGLFQQLKAGIIW
ncbi:MAG: response regulator [Leadbetterella sp.]|nr:response regulator [Leadbetterella sp.]